MKIELDYILTGSIMTVSTNKNTLLNLIVTTDGYKLNDKVSITTLNDKNISAFLYLIHIISDIRRENQSAQCRKILPSFLLFKKQQIFHLPSSFNARNYLAFIAAEGNVLLVNVPVPGFQFLYQLAFGKVFAA